MTLLFVDCVSNFLRTAADGRFDWGGTPSIRKQRRLMVNSEASETLCRGLKTNVGLTGILTKWVPDKKLRLNEQPCLR